MFSATCRWSWSMANRAALPCRSWFPTRLAAQLWRSTNCYTRDTRGLVSSPREITPRIRAGIWDTAKRWPNSDYPRIQSWSSLTMRPRRGGGRRTVARLLQLPMKPTAILCFNKSLAVGAYQAAIEAGLEVPHDLSVVAFDNDDPAGAEALTPSLTTVDLPHFEMGSRAAHVILDVIGGASYSAGKKDPRMPVLCYLNRRDSVAEPLSN